MWVVSSGQGSGGPGYPSMDQLKEPGRGVFTSLHHPKQQALQVGPRTPLKLFCLPDKHPGPGGGHDHAPLPRPLLQHTLWAEPKDGLQSGDVPSGKVSPGDPPQPSHTPARRMSHMGGTVPCPKQPRGTEAVGVVQHLPGQPAQQTHFSCILSLSITPWRSRSVTQGIVSAWL